jgi:hypothetical protein
VEVEAPSTAGPPLPRRLRAHRKLITRGALLAAAAGLLLAAGARMQRDGFLGTSVMPYLRGGLDWPARRLRGMLAEPEHLAIDIKWADRQRLAAQRERALESGALLLSESDFVPATISGPEGAVRVRMRLKGDGIDHLQGDKWSFRVKTRGEDTLHGMKRFSLHHPRVRNWIFEWLAQRAMEREDVVALRYEFIDVSLNGKSLGIYALEEHFEKRLIEHNRRREGPIIRFNEDLMWRQIMTQIRPFRGSARSGAGTYVAGEVDGFQTARHLADPELRELYLQGVGLLEAFRAGELATNEAFDAPRMATYFALIDVLGGEHGARWNNIRFYYNPLTARLEPIAFDMVGGKPTRSLSIVGAGIDIRERSLLTRFDEFNHTLFADREFAALYLAELGRLSDPAWLDGLLAEVDAELQEALTILYSEFPTYEFDPAVLRRNQAYVRSLLVPTECVQAYLEEREGTTVTVRAGNIQMLPVEVLALESTGGARAELDRPLLLEPRRFDRPTQTHPVVFRFPEGVAPEAEFALVHRVVGGPARNRALVPHPHAGLALAAENALRSPSTVPHHPFIHEDEGGGRLVIAPGRHRLETDLVIEAGTSVECGPGTELDLTAGAMILSRSPLRFIGQAGAPIVIGSSDGTGGGILVTGCADTSTLQHVVLRGLAGIERAGWNLTGALTFHEAPAALSQVSVTANACEDGLNLVRTSFSIDGCTFTDALSDALDADFCNGSITGSRFVNTGNDAIDVSGSMIEIDGVSISGCGDKGVSAGEASTVNVLAIEIAEARVALACKDLSRLAVAELVLRDCRFGLAVFQKKSEFGPGELRVGELRAEGVGELILLEPGSTLVLRGVPVRAENERTHEIVYGEAEPTASGR